MSEIRFIPNSELKNIASAGNGFSKLADAESVAKARSGAEIIVKQNDVYYLYEKQNDSVKVNNSASKEIKPINFVDLNIIEVVTEKNKIQKPTTIDNKPTQLDNKPNNLIKGVSNKVENFELDGKSSDGNCFSKFSDAESVAKNLTFNTAIVYKDNSYQLYKISRDNIARFEKDDTSFIDGSVVSIQKKGIQMDSFSTRGTTIYNPNFETSTKVANEKTAYVNNGKIMLHDKEFKISGLNVYDIADISNQKDLEKTLKLLSDSGVNTIRFWAFSKNNPDKIINVLDTSKKMGLDLKFIPVLGNQWKHCEASNSAKEKDNNWYVNEYKKTYLPHVLNTTKALVNREEVLMIELMNEPTAKHTDLKNFADDVSTQIRQVYTDYEKKHNTKIPRHLISLGTDAMDQREGMRGDDYKDLYGLPNIDVATAHDYTFDKGQSEEDSISNDFRNYINYAKELKKPFFIGEIGVKVKNRSSQEALRVMSNRLEVYKDQDISGVLLWGPEPNNHSIDGDGFGFKFNTANDSLKNIFAVFNE